MSNQLVIIIQSINHRIDYTLCKPPWCGQPCAASLKEPVWRESNSLHPGLQTSSSCSCSPGPKSHPHKRQGLLSPNKLILCVHSKAGRRTSSQAACCGLFGGKMLIASLQCGCPGSSLTDTLAPRRPSSPFYHRCHCQDEVMVL